MGRAKPIVLSAIILAAGESVRMGRPKQLMPLGESTILEQTIEEVLSSPVDEVIVVLGYRAEEIGKKLAHKQIKVGINPHYRRGMSASVATGLRLVNDKAEAVMLVLGDQPFVPSQTIDDFITAFSHSDKGIAVPTYEGRRGNPVIFSIKYREELLELCGDVGGKEIIGRHPDDVLEVAVGSDGIWLDIDNMDDYRSHLDRPPKR